MSDLSQSDATPDFLKTAVEYRDRLKAELAKVDEFLETAGRRPGAGHRDYPDFLLIGNDEVLDSLRPGEPRSRAVH